MSLLSPTEQPVSQTLQEELAASLLLDLLSENYDWSHRVPQSNAVATFGATVKGFLFSVPRTIISHFAI